MFLNLLNVFFIFLLGFLSSISYKNVLPKNSWNKIQNIIKITDSNSPVRQKVNDLLYRCFEKWAVNQAYEFKIHHRYKCRNIRLDDLILSSKMGLYQSIDKYNGTSSFPDYSKIYIQGALIECLTEFHPLTNLPKSYRKKSKNNLTPRERLRYKKQLETSWVSYEDFWRFDKMRKDIQEDQILNLIQEREKHVELWKNLMDQQKDTMNQKIIQYKYNYDFEVIRSNREIAQILSYSEEYVRLRLSTFFQKVNLDER
jgi:hypothetical protein